ncbi:MAG: DUF1674 domain-containing protein [Gammaproteobacteria bacterium]|nr:DUF1674 domain-containing protein [Gammaproteobacteria bacterium]TVQ49633.1 MAG: DUF1674 domain-containing protein [Gammaproteobacteria bacterium]
MTEKAGNAAAGRSVEPRVWKPETRPEPTPEESSVAASTDRVPAGGEQPVVRELNGPSGPEPTRYGDWEKNGRCIDF